LRMTINKQSGYAPVNGLQLYFEIEGTGDPLVYLGAGFAVAGVTRLTGLMDRHQVISVDMQGRGRTADIERPLSFEQQAEDAMLVAIRYPERAGKVTTYGSAFGRFGEAYKPQVLSGTMQLTPDSPVFDFQRSRYQEVAPDPSHWPVIWAKFGATPWKGLSREELASVKVPVLIAVGDQDWVRLDQAIAYFESIPGAELAIVPDAGHFVLDAEPEKLLPIVARFLDKTNAKLPFATTGIPYLRGVSR
jgi:pimeloyl-ACP methyl ester carboxylesterase